MGAMLGISIIGVQMLVAVRPCYEASFFHAIASFRFSCAHSRR
jgi:hypothetical protein